MNLIKSCDICGGPIKEGKYSSLRKYCSPTCHKMADKKKFRTYNPSAWGGIYGSNLVNCNTSGAISELVVSAKIMANNIPVFRALSPSCECDLVIIKNNKTLTIEVRTGQCRSPKGKNPNSFCFSVDIGNFNKRKRSSADIFAVVLPDDVYFISNRKAGSGRLLKTEASTDICKVLDELI